MAGYTLYGSDKRRGAPFISLNIFGGGWGGRSDTDGVSAAVSICQGNVQNAPVEVQESYYPLLIEKHELAQDSCGSGEFRGGLGVEIVVKSDDDMFLNTQFQRTIFPPWGILGGLAGDPNQAYIEDAAGRRRSAVAVNRHLVKAGERVIMRSAGGGGYGNPQNRPLTTIERDVRLGYVSATKAENDYNVVLNEAGAIDDARTQKKRARQ